MSNAMSRLHVMQSFKSQCKIFTAIIEILHRRAVIFLTYYNDLNVQRKLEESSIKY